MILVEFTPDGQDMVRISDKDRPLTYQWFGYLKSFSSIKLDLSSVHGGYAKPTFSEMALWPEMFEESWPPANGATIVVKWTEDTEDNASTLFSGKAGLDSFDREGVVYTLTQPEFDLTIVDGTTYSSTDLEGFLTTLCTSLSLSTDFTNGRATSPDVSFTVDGDTQAIDLMIEVCKWFSHGIIIDSPSNTLYLYDMLSSGTPTSLTEFDFLPSMYRRHTPISLVVRGNKSVSGSSPNGEEVEFDQSYGLTADRITHLTNIRDLLEKDIIELNCMIKDGAPGVLQDITTYDESTIVPTTFTGKVISVIYNFDTEKMQLEAVGDVS